MLFCLCLTDGAQCELAGLGGFLGRRLGIGSPAHFGEPRTPAPCHLPTQGMSATLSSGIARMPIWSHEQVPPMPEHLETSAAWALRACGLRCAFCRSILCSSCRAGVQSAGSERRLSLCLSLDTQSTWHLPSVSRIHGAFWAVGKCLHVISSVPGRFT